MKCKICKSHCAWVGKEESEHGKCLVGYTPKTNADRIRSMTDEELAEYFTQLYYDGPKFYCPAVADVGEGTCAANYDCRQCWLDWLKQEVKND